MFRTSSTGQSRVLGFPRIRGDVPRSSGMVWHCSKFSPHTRGCSSATIDGHSVHIVFPAYAGMFLPNLCAISFKIGFPRIRGDVPRCRSGPTCAASFSPHTRGCSSRARIPGRLRLVFPAYAGMFLWGKCPLSYALSFPRIRGDVPSAPLPGTRSPEFSPHTRGCSGIWSSFTGFLKVFPAYAGMFRSCMLARAKVWSFPRIRGDVPPIRELLRKLQAFSPHTRGCSVISWFYTGSNPVFPAYAGMFRLLRVVLPAVTCFPRIRGDVPENHAHPNLRPGFSPHTRGCSRQYRDASGTHVVFPAYAGMFRAVSAS